MLEIKALNYVELFACLYVLNSLKKQKMITITERIIRIKLGMPVKLI